MTPARLLAAVGFGLIGLALLCATLLGLAETAYFVVTGRSLIEMVGR